MIGDI